MRTLKFRVWDEKYREWDNSSIILYPETNLLKQGRVIQQFTGFTDNIGKEIYEGDIVLLNFGPWFGQEAEVVWNENGFYFKINNLIIQDTIYQITYQFENCILIGNIFQKK